MSVSSRALFIALTTLLWCLSPPAAGACEVRDVRVAPDGSGGARLSILHDGAATLRRQARDDMLVLFVKGCRASPGAHSAAAPTPPARAVRWSYHPENDAVWVVADLWPGTRVDIASRSGQIDVTLSLGDPAPGAWPLGFRVLHPLPAPVLELMTRSWRPDCPVPLEDLSLVQITHLGFDDTEKQGDLVVHRDIADEVVAIFAELLRGGCAVERVQLADFFADDAASMAVNNTSAFACRFVTGSSTVYSTHSFGRAIDLNPVQNPYVRGDAVLPPAGRDYLARDRPRPGLVRRGNACHRPFVSRGWTWGGDFRSLKDYQHFEKPVP